MSKRKSVWLTYAWEDNKDGDVDFAAQELIRAGIDVKLDRWNLTAGRRLWEQIEAFIQTPSESDAWLLYATQASLGSQACREEFAYALDRALQTRGGDFPVIALFPATVDRSLIPAGIRTRLFVSLTDPSWKERIAAAVDRRPPDIEKPEVKPYALSIHDARAKLGKQALDRYIIELRPRAGTWSPFFAAIPLNEKEHVLPTLVHGSSKRIPMNVILMDTGEYVSDDGKWWVVYAANEATPTQSYYIFCRNLPSILVFGIHNATPQYRVSF